MTLGGIDGFSDQQVPDEVLEEILASLDSTEYMWADSDIDTNSIFSMYNSSTSEKPQSQSVQIATSSISRHEGQTYQPGMEVAAYNPNIVIKQEFSDDDGQYDQSKQRCLIPETVSQYYESLPTNGRSPVKTKLQNINGAMNVAAIGNVKCERSFSLTELDFLLNNTDVYAQDNSFYEADDHLSVPNESIKANIGDNCQQQRTFADLSLVKSEPAFVAYDGFSTNQTGAFPTVSTTAAMSCEDQAAIETAIPIDLLKQVKAEIDQTCTLTAIPLAPESWTAEHVQRWVTYTLHHFQLPLTRVENFNVNGSTLALFTEDDFKKRSPEAGATLFAQLEIWMNALALCQDIETASVPIPKPNPMYMNLDSVSMVAAQQHQHQQQQQQQQQQHCGPVAFPGSPTSSNDSEMDSPRRDSLSSLSAESDQGYYHAEEDGIKQNIHLWQFLKDLLLQPQFYGNCIRWLDRKNGIFKIEDSARVARLWGKRKNRPAMNYDKLSRSIRQYYKKGIIKKTEHSKRLIYRFCHPYLL